MQDSKRIPRLIAIVLFWFSFCYFSMLFSVEARALYLECNSVSEAKVLLDGSIEIIHAAKKNDGDASRVRIGFAECIKVNLDDAGTLVSTGHVILKFDGGIVNASRHLEEVKRIRVTPKNVRTRPAHLYRKGAKGIIYVY